MREDPLANLWPLLGRHVAFHRRLVDLTDSVKSALMLSQSIYWTRHGVDLDRRGDWFHKTAQQWSLEIGLSMREQVTARDRLRGERLMDERRIGMPAVNHFRVNLSELTSRLQAVQDDKPWLDAEGCSSIRVDRHRLNQLLGPTIAFHRVLVDCGGGVHAALLLSRLLHLTRKQLRRLADPWIEGSVQHWHDELGLSRRELEAARSDLLAAGLCLERLVGRPPALGIRICLDSLQMHLARIRHGIPATEDAIPAVAAAEGWNPAFRIRQNVETCLRESRTQELRKPPSQIRRLRPNRFDESAEPNREKSTSEELQEPPPRAGEGPVCGQQAGCGGDLIFPDQLLPQERDAARHLLVHANANAQVLLDELAGRLSLPGVASPVAYLRGLIQRANEGVFVPEMAARIHADRQRRLTRAEALRQEQRARECVEAEPLDPEAIRRLQERRERTRSRLAELRQQLAGRAQR